MSRLRIVFILAVLLVLTVQAYCASSPAILSRWVTLRSDAKNAVKDIILSEVNEREGFSSSQEEKANLSAVEDEKEKDDTSYKNAVSNAARTFARAKKRRDDLTSQFQAVSTEIEEQQKNIKTIKSGVENLDSQIARYNLDIKAQREALKKWLQTEKQGEALVAVLFTQGFKDKAHTLEALADQASAPLMAQHMGTYIQSFTKVSSSAVDMDFIRAIEEGSAKWNNEEPIRIVLQKSNRGTTYLRLKRYELYPFQAPQKGRVSPASKNIQAAIVTSRKSLEGFLTQNGYKPSDIDLDRVDRAIRETTQLNSAAEEGVQEQIRSFQDRINSLQQRVAAASSEKEVNITLLGKKDVAYKKIAQDTAVAQTRKEEADKAFQDAQKTLHDIRRVHESIIVKTALAAARGSQSPAEVSAEAIIDKLAEVKNDAKMQHSSSTTEVTNFQVTGESSTQAVTEARITAVRLIAFINEGDSVRVKMAFRVRTVLEEGAGETARDETPQPAPRPAAKAPRSKPADREPEISRDTPSPVVPIKRNVRALGAADLDDILFEIVNVRYVEGELSVFVDITNTSDNAERYVAFYDENYRWAKSRLTDNGGKEHEVTRVILRKGQQQMTMRDAGSRGVPISPRTTQTAQLIFKGIPPRQKAVRQVVLHPWVYQRMIVWRWKDQDFAFPNIRIGR